jgi:hypothetical protein
VPAYLASKEQFLKDAPTIKDVVAAAMKKHHGMSASPREYQSWKNSLGNAISRVMHDPAIPADAAVAVQYRLNGRKFRIDFLVAGKYAGGHDSVAIVELKQWTGIASSDMKSHVKTYLGCAIREETHPLYQARSHASHLIQFNGYVYSNNVDATAACACLHNCLSA